MNVDLRIINGTIVTAKESFKGGLAINNEKIVKIDTENNLPPAKKTINAHGNYILPGVIDAHVHFRDPGMEYKEDYSTGSTAAAFGGVTLVCDMPNTNPPTDNADIVRKREALIKEKSFIDVALFGVIIPENIDQIGSLAKAGVIGYKMYMGESFGEVLPLQDGELINAFEQVSLTGLRIGFHAESDQLLKYYLAKIKSSGRNDPMAFVESRPIICEVESIQRIALFSKYTGAKVHILHLSSKDGAMMIKEWKDKGVDITTETCPHYLFISADRYMCQLKSLLRVNPPVRQSEDGQYLFGALLNGTIDFITTDHAPHSIEEKVGEDIWNANSGFIGVETSVQVMLSEAVNKRGMPLNHFVKITSENPAKAWGLWPQKGSFQIGSDADVTIVDLNKEWKINEINLHSKNKITPWNNWGGMGKPISTIVRGHPIVIDEEFVAHYPIGKLISPVNKEYKEYKE